jgi:ketosteroid isomerase-like protein
VGDPGVWVNNWYLTPTVEAVRAEWESEKEARSATHIFPSEESIAVLSPDHAVQVMVAEWNATDAQGVTTPDYPLTLTLVWVRENGGWRILHWHQSWTLDVEGD